ncbi:unnamed protein product, partial [Ilex paraguariensis]
MHGIGSGACCVTALIEGEEMAISNLGDCRAVLCRSGVAEALTVDHRAGQDDERSRIENMGGYVEIHRELGESIGDAHLKDWVLAEPDTKILNLTPDMEYLLLASDGLWEEVGNQEAVDIVMGTCSVDKKPEPTGDPEKENDNEFGCIRRQEMKMILAMKTKVLPPTKARRVSLVSQMKVHPQSPNQENSSYKKRPAPGRLVAACKELVNLAVARGSLDDVTVMIIDLNQFKNHCIAPMVVQHHKDE